MMDRCALRSVSNPEKNSVAGLHPTRFTAKEKRKRKREREREKEKKEKEKKGKLILFFGSHFHFNTKKFSSSLDYFRFDSLCIKVFNLNCIHA